MTTHELLEEAARLLEVHGWCHTAELIRTDCKGTIPNVPLAGEEGQGAAGICREALLVLVELKQIKRRIESGIANDDEARYYETHKEGAWTGAEIALGLTAPAAPPAPKVPEEVMKWARAVAVDRRLAYPSDSSIELPVALYILSLAPKEGS